MHTAGIAVNTMDTINVSIAQLNEYTDKQLARRAWRRVGRVLADTSRKYDRRLANRRERLLIHGTTDCALGRGLMLDSELQQAARRLQCVESRYGDAVPPRLFAPKTVARDSHDVRSRAVHLLQACTWTSLAFRLRVL